MGKEEINWCLINQDNPCPYDSQSARAEKCGIVNHLRSFYNIEKEKEIDRLLQLAQEDPELFREICGRRLRF